MDVLDQLNLEVRNHMKSDQRMCRYLLIIYTLMPGI